MALATLRALTAIPTGTGPVAMSSRAASNFQRWKPIFQKVGEEAGISPAFLAAVSKRESDPNWSADSVNPNSGAKGLMQLMPSNVAALGLEHSWREPEPNIRGGARILLEQGYGRKNLGEVLMGYGGFDEDVRGERDDPAPYIEYILINYANLWLRHGMSPVPTF